LRTIAFACILVLILGSPRARSCSADQPPLPNSHPPEEERFDNIEFRSELLRRDLTELLDYYKRARPPAPRGPDADLVRYEELLAGYQDISLSQEQRVAALDQALAILEKLIAARPDPPRSWQWRLRLGKDLLFRRAEPYYYDVLYRGWTEADGRELQRLSARAEETFRELGGEIDAFLARVDNMGHAEYRRVERSGLLEAADTIKPQADYFLQWSRFYRILADEGINPESRNTLSQIVGFLRGRTKRQPTDYTQVPHDETGVQVQSQLLVGMCYRRLGESPEADEYLLQVIKTHSQLPDSERSPLRWAYALAFLERARLARDVGRYDLAHRYLEHIRSWSAKQAPDNFALTLAVALLDGDIYKRQAEHAREKSRNVQAERLEKAARQPLLALLRSEPAHQGDVFRAVAALVDADADPASLDALQQNAVIAGLLREATILRASTGPDADRIVRDRIKENLQRVLDIGSLALADGSALGLELRPYTLFNVAVAHYQLGKPSQAVERFVELVQRYPDFERSGTALDYAVRIAADYYGQDPTKSDPRRLSTFVAALSVLDAQQPDSEQAGYWRYYLADALARLGRLQESIAMFARVPPSGRNYYSAVYLEIVKRWELYNRLREQGAPASDLREHLTQVIEAAEKARAVLASATAETEREARDLRSYQGGTLLVTAEAYVQPALDEPQRALDLLADFHEEFADRDDLVGWALRLRIEAYRRLGQLEQAGRVVDLYLEREPQTAGPVMDQLLNSLMEEARRLRDAGLPYEALAAQSLELAGKLYTWSRENPLSWSQADPDSLEIRLAGAHLLNGNYERALEIVTKCLQREARADPDRSPCGLEARRYQAEALYQLGRYQQAQPIFYDLWVAEPEGSAGWWRALLRSLQCHTEMNTAPARIVAEVRKLRHTWPDMGGPYLKAQFDALEQINTQKSATSVGGGRP
jgi:hypothetical protein